MARAAPTVRHGARSSAAQRLRSAAAARVGANGRAPLLLAWVSLVWLWAAISPFDRFDWLLENLLFFTAMAVFIGTYRRFPLSDASYALIALFMTLHLIGSHYTYAETPIGFWLQDVFSLDRNHYDRVVHFGFGLLWFYPGREALLRLISISGTWAGGIALALISGIGGFYEVIEAIVASIVSPDLGDAYLGTQGDIWDAQWDMLSQCVGGSIAWVVVVAVARLQLLSSRTATGIEPRQSGQGS